MAHAVPLSARVMECAKVECHADRNDGSRSTATLGRQWCRGRWSSTRDPTDWWASASTTTEDRGCRVPRLWLFGALLPPLRRAAGPHEGQRPYTAACLESNDACLGRQCVFRPPLLCESLPARIRGWCPFGLLTEGKKLRSLYAPARRIVWQYLAPSSHYSGRLLRSATRSRRR